MGTAVPGSEKIRRNDTMKNKNVLKLTQCALIAALAYVGFYVLRIDIPVGTERTAVHMGIFYTHVVSIIYRSCPADNIVTTFEHWLC